MSFRNLFSLKHFKSAVKLKSQFTETVLLSFPLKLVNSYHAEMSLPSTGRKCLSY